MLPDKVPTVKIVPVPVVKIKEKDFPVLMMRVFAILIVLENHVIEFCQVGKRLNGTDCAESGETITVPVTPLKKREKKQKTIEKGT